MAMTDLERREALLIWARKRCANPSIEIEDIALFLEEAIPATKTNKAKQSESLADYSVTLNKDALNDIAKQYLIPFMRVRFP